LCAPAAKTGALRIEGGPHRPSVASDGRLQNGAAIVELLADGWKLILAGVRITRAPGSTRERG